MGGEVPLSYYLSNSAPVPKDYMETINIIAGAGGFKKLKFKIDVKHSILRLNISLFINYRLGQFTYRIVT